VRKFALPAGGNAPDRFRFVRKWGGGGGNSTPPQKPVADAGTDKTVPMNVLVQLDAAGAFPRAGDCDLSVDPGCQAARQRFQPEQRAVANPTFLPDHGGIPMFSIWW